MRDTRTNDELLRMEGVGVRIERTMAGWETTIIRLDAHTKTLHEETWPVRVRFILAIRDAKRFAPNVQLASFDAMGKWWLMMCERGLLALECGVKLERSAA